MAFRHCTVIVLFQYYRLMAFHSIQLISWFHCIICLMKPGNIFILNSYPQCKVILCANLNVRILNRQMEKSLSVQFFHSLPV